MCVQVPLLQIKHTVPLEWTDAKFRTLSADLFIIVVRLRPSRNTIYAVSAQ